MWISNRSVVNHYGPTNPYHLRTRTWSREIGEHVYSFSFTEMVNGEIRYSWRRMALGKAWEAHKRAPFDCDWQGYRTISIWPDGTVWTPKR